MNVVRVGVGVIVPDESGRVLIGQRKCPHGQGLWGFPGGHLEMGETPAGCAQREAMEEAGIEVDNLRLVGVTNNIFEPDKQYITLYMACQSFRGTIENREPDKLERWEWHAWDALPRPLFGPVEVLLSDPEFRSPEIFRFSSANRYKISS